VALTSVDEAMSFEAQILALKDAQLEARLALQLLQQIGGGVGLSEVDLYLAAVGRVLDTTPENPTASDAPKFAHALRAARTRLLDEASSFALWLNLTEALDPGGGPHRVPARFVRWKSPPETEALTFTKSESRVRRAVAEFLGDDAHPGSGQG
jgi:hypothetical protein